MIASTYIIELLPESVNPRQRLRSASDPGIRYYIPFNKKTRFNDRNFAQLILRKNSKLTILDSYFYDLF